MLAAQHLDNEKIEVPIAVDIREIHAHGSKGLLAHRQPGQQTEMTGAIVKPEAIHGLEIIAHVNVGETVLVNVAHLHTQSEVPRRRHWFAVFIEEPF